uniref:sensor histidine kinase n=1 Tax=Fulvivirga sp. TaxID=1931237 RepID=UPI00404BA24B
NFISALLPLASVIFIIAVGVILLNQHFRKNLIQQQLDKEELKTNYNQKLLRSSIEIQEIERKRMAADLHDEIGAILSITRMHIIQLEEANTGMSNQLYALQNIRTLTESALASTRRISHELMPPQLESFGIIKTLESIAAKINTSEAVQVLITSEMLPTLSWDIQLALYRVCLELISNTIKHANATEIQIDFYYIDSKLVIEYKDDGIGIETNDKSKGLGIKNIEARILAISGRLLESPLNENGFRIKLEIPENGPNS